MNAVGGIAENLAAAAIGGIVTAGWRLRRKRTGSKDIRAMWDPFLTEDSCIVEGRVSAEMLCESLPDRVPQELQDQATQFLPHLERHLVDAEPSGLMGKGDHEAIVRIQAGLARAGLPRTLLVRPEDELGEHRRDHLIVVGGSDVNSVTRELLSLVQCRVAIARNNFDRNVVQDLLYGQQYEPNIGAEDVRDYGILIKAPSPYQERRSVVILAGAYGFGCVAAGSLAVNNIERMAELSRKHPEGFECIVSYRRSGTTPGVREENRFVLSRSIRD